MLSVYVSLLYRVLYVLVFVSCFGVIINCVYLHESSARFPTFHLPDRLPAAARLVCLLITLLITDFYIFLCISSGCICMFVFVLDCLFCCHHGVIKQIIIINNLYFNHGRRLLCSFYRSPKSWLLLFYCHPIFVVLCKLIKMDDDDIQCDSKKLTPYIV